MSNALNQRRYRIRKMLKEQYLLEENEMIEEIIENLTDEYINLHLIQSSIEEYGVSKVENGKVVPSRLLDTRKNIQSTIKNQTELLYKLTIELKEKNSALELSQNDPVLIALGMVKK